MRAFRSALFLLFETVTVIPWSFLCMLAVVLPREQHYWFTVRWLRMQIWALVHIVGIRWKVQGAENLPDGPAILLSKHQSTWETFFYPVFMPKPLCYVFKRELIYVPFFGWGIWLLGMIHIDRRKGSDAFEEVVTQGVKRLAQGRWIIMFPEGTRIPVGQKGRYKSGGPRLAVRTGAPVVPIAVNAGECWPKGSWIMNPGLVTVSIGKPIATAGRPVDEITAATESWIESEMRRISPTRYAHQEITA